MNTMNDFHSIYSTNSNGYTTKTFLSLFFDFFKFLGWLF
jgi:hypothetical protein